MKPYYADEAVTLYHGDCLDVLATLPDASVDAVVTDPPYDLTAGKKGGTGIASVNLASPYGRARIGTGNGAGGFMGKEWDATGIAFDPATWAACLRVLKPGGHLLAFGGSRTGHRLACAIEDAGFELRDTIAWLYGSGFPKSLDVSKAIDKAAGAEREIPAGRHLPVDRVVGIAGNDGRCVTCARGRGGQPGNCRCPKSTADPAGHVRGLRMTALFKTPASALPGAGLTPDGPSLPSGTAGAVGNEKKPAGHGEERTNRCPVTPTAPVPTVLPPEPLKDVSCPHRSAAI